MLIGLLGLDTLMVWLNLRYMKRSVSKCDTISLVGWRLK